MVVFSVILFVFSAFLIATGALICGGKYELIYDLHLVKVKNLRGYCREFGIAVMCLSIPMIACGVLQLFRPERIFVGIAIGVLVAGVIVDYLFCCRIQKKYNAEMF